jgi:hypothetical protein
VALQIKKLQRQLLRNTRALQNSVVQKEEARAEVAMSAKNKATIKSYKGKTTKKGRATRKATADFQETANTANMALVQYQNKEVVPTAAHHQEDEREQDMWKVLDHRLGNNGTPELQVDTCDTSDEDRVSWYKVSPLLKDGLEAKVKSYILQHCNTGPWLKIITKIDGSCKNKKGKKKAVAEEIRNERPEEKALKVPDQLPATCHHDMYEEDIYYTAEHNPYFCKEGYYLFGLKCAGCAVNFIADGKLGGYKPTSSTPVYCCVLLDGKNGRKKDNREICRHAICSRCWKTGVVNSNAQTGRRASRRSRTS